MFTFLKYSIDCLRYQLRSVTKGATQDNLSVSKLISFKFPVPHLSTQRHIGEILRIYGDLIEKLQPPPHSSSGAVRSPSLQGVVCPFKVSGT